MLVKRNKLDSLLDKKIKRSRNTYDIKDNIISYDVNVDFDYGGEKYKWSLQENPFSGVVGTSISEIVKLDYNSGNRTNVQKNVGLGKNYSIDDMRNDLSNALKMENYEEAAKLRDKINKIQSKSKE